MSCKHKKYDVMGVQFHPESIITEHGLKLLKIGLVINYNLEQTNLSFFHILNL